jgi:hypothetical protein
MTSSQMIGLTVSVIQRDIKKATVIIASLNDIYHKCKNHTKSAVSINFVTPYVYRVMEKASVVEGIPCRKCDEMIKPEEYCYAKYKHNNRLNYIPSYYHIRCFDKLFH